MKLTLTYFQSRKYARHGIKQKTISTTLSNALGVQSLVDILWEYNSPLIFFSYKYSLILPGYTFTPGSFRGSFGGYSEGEEDQFRCGLCV